jgi:hypothetical protein
MLASSSCLICTAFFFFAFASEKKRSETIDKRQSSSARSLRPHDTCMYFCYLSCSCVVVDRPAGGRVKVRSVRCGVCGIMHAQHSTCTDMSTYRFIYLMNSG